jgi:hypothetical protein
MTPPRLPPCGWKRGPDPSSLRASSGAGARPGARMFRSSMVGTRYGRSLVSPASLGSTPTSLNGLTARAS